MAPTPRAVVLFGPRRLPRAWSSTFQTSLLEGLKARLEPGTIIHRQDTQHVGLILEIKELPRMNIICTDDLIGYGQNITPTMPINLSRKSLESIKEPYGQGHPAHI